jgi:hypothetical protein
MDIGFVLITIMSSTYEAKYSYTKNYTSNKQQATSNNWLPTRCFTGDGQNTGEYYNNNTFTTTTSLSTPETMILAG